MKKQCAKAILTAALFFGISSMWAQQTPSATVVNPVNNYNYHDAFGPHFYTKNGTSTRTASGQPGIEYWQNRADSTLR